MAGGCMNCGSNTCSEPIMVADQDGKLYPVVNGRIQVPNYGEHPKFVIKPGQGAPFKITLDEDLFNSTGDYCFTIDWDSRTSINNNRELVGPDGSTILLTIPETELPRIEGWNGISEVNNQNGTILLGLKLDPNNPPAGFTINQDGCIEAT